MYKLRAEEELKEARRERFEATLNEGSDESTHRSGSPLGGRDRDAHAEEARRPRPQPPAHPILTQRPLPQDTLAEVSKHKDKGLLNQVQARQKAYLSAIVDRCREGR